MLSRAGGFGVVLCWVVVVCFGGVVCVAHGGGGRGGVSTLAIAGAIDLVVCVCPTFAVDLFVGLVLLCV